jgi:MFS family permease
MALKATSKDGFYGWINLVVKYFLKANSKDGFYGWINLAVMFFFNIAMMLMIMSFSVFLRFWVEEFSWSYKSISGAQSVGMILSGLAAPMVGIFIMKNGAKRAIVIGNLLSSVGLAMLACQHHIWELYMGYGVIVGLGMGIGGMLAMMTVVNDWFVIKRSVALSISMASMSLTGVVGSPTLMALANTIGWRKTYLIISALVFLFCTLAPALFLKNKPENLGQVPDGPNFTSIEKGKADGSMYKNLYRTPVDFTVKEALRTRTMWLLVTFFTLQFLTMNALITNQIPYLIDIGIPRTMAAMAGGVMSAFMGISSLGVGFLGLRFKMHALAVSSIIIGIAGYIIILFARSFEVVLVYNVILGLGFGIQSIAMGNLFPDYFGRSEFPKIMSYSMPFTTIVGSLGAPLAGYVRDKTHSFMLAFQVSLVLLVIAFLCIIFAKPPVHPSLKETRT